MPQHPPIELRGSVPIIGSGPIASAPDAGVYPAGVMWLDNVTGITWVSNGVTWDLAALPDVGNAVVWSYKENVILADRNNTIWGGANA